MIDLRSDTVTRPTEAMRQAMATAEVGDDVFGDDPTVAALESRTAEILGKEAALYMPSGTMTNQVAIRCHTEPGDEIIIEATAHPYFYESGAPAGLSGVMCRLIEGNRGVFTAQQLKALLRPSNIHFPPTKLLCVENTHNRGGGTIWPIETMEEVANLAHEAGLKTHLDGARLWHACAATGLTEARYAACFDTVSVCFSKGLGAPVGSALAGTADFIQRARRFRKMFGGGMRQAGVIAAAALYALQHHRRRLGQDHAKAKRFAEGLAELPGIQIAPDSVQTNIVFFSLTSISAQQFADSLRKLGVLVGPAGSNLVRAVTHLDISDQQISQALQAAKQVLAK